MKEWIPFGYYFVTNNSHACRKKMILLMFPCKYYYLRTFSFHYLSVFHSMWAEFWTGHIPNFFPQCIPFFWTVCLVCFFNTHNYLVLQWRFLFRGGELHPPNLAAFYFMYKSFFKKKSEFPLFLDWNFFPRYKANNHTLTILKSVLGAPLPVRHSLLLP